jgi:hypothetical protein
MKNIYSAIDLTPLKEFPIAPSGYDNVDYLFIKPDLEVTYSCIDEFDQKRTGKLFFDFVIAVSIEYESNDIINLPEHSDVLYSHTSNLREGFKGYKVWFSNNELISVVCKHVLVDNERF